MYPEEAVLSYIEKHGMCLASTIAKELHLNYLEVVSILRKLDRDGKISLKQGDHPTYRHLSCTPVHSFIHPRLTLPNFRPSNYDRRGDQHHATYAPIHVYPPPSEEEKRKIKLRKELKRIVDEYRRAYFDGAEIDV